MLKRTIWLTMSIAVIYYASIVLAEEYTNLNETLVKYTATAIIGGMLLYTKLKSRYKLLAFVAGFLLSLTLMVFTLDYLP